MHSFSITSSFGQEKNEMRIVNNTDLVITFGLGVELEHNPLTIISYWGSYYFEHEILSNSFYNKIKSLLFF